MVTAGRWFALPMFDWLQFGPAHMGLTDATAIDYSVFTFGVLGAVIMGWMTLIHCILPLVKYERDARVRCLVRNGIWGCTILWFLMDTGFSVAVRQYTHALFNIPFGLSLAIPLYILSTNDCIMEESKMRD